MTILGKALLAAVAVLSLASSARAEPAATHDNVFFYYPETGRAVMGQIDQRGVEASLQHAKPLNGPVVIISQGGKAYLVEDPMEKMADGQRMIDFLDKMTYGSR